MYTNKLEEYLMTEEGQSSEEEWVKLNEGIMQKKALEGKKVVEQTYREIGAQ
jgi:hypothetical protein